MRLLPCADSGLLVEVDGGLTAVRALEQGLRAAAVPGVVDIVPGLGSVLLEIDPLLTDPAAAAAAVRVAAAAPAPPPAPHRLVELPVCFDGDAAPDLEDIAAAAGMSRKETVAALCAAALEVAIVGHLPGLPYLRGLPAALDLPRRAVPRPRVPAGSLGVAAAMCCVYPIAAPGGWHLAGRTPARLFDAASDPPCLLTAGDRVRLRAIDRGEHDRLAAAAAAGTWSPPVVPPEPS